MPTGFARTSRRRSITTPRLVADHEPISRVIIDTSVVIDLEHVPAGDLPAELDVSAVMGHLLRRLPRRRRKREPIRADPATSGVRRSHSASAGASLSGAMSAALPDPSAGIVAKRISVK
jgi:hypothetical protein